MRRAPATPVRARCVCECVALLAVQEHELRATTLHCNAKRRSSSHFRVPSSQPALQKPHFISSQATLQQLFSHSKLLHREAFTHRSQKLLHTEPFTQRSFYTEACTQRSQKLLRTASFYAEKFTHTEAFTQSSF